MASVFHCRVSTHQTKTIRCMLNVEAYIKHLCTFMMTSNQFIMQLYCAGGRPSVLLNFQGGTSVCYEGGRAGHVGEMANNRQ